jgi:hypothetical protein
VTAIPRRVHTLTTHLLTLLSIRISTFTFLALLAFGFSFSFAQLRIVCSAGVPLWYCGRSG